MHNDIKAFLNVRYIYIYIIENMEWVCNGILIIKSIYSNFGINNSSIDDALLA
jgi:hypothetical protein